MLKRDIAASSLKIWCKYFIPVKSYGKTNMKFVLCTGEKYRWGLTYFGQLFYFLLFNVMLHVSSPFLLRPSFSYY